METNEYEDYSDSDEHCLIDDDAWRKGGLHGDNELGYTANWNKPNTSIHLRLTLYRSLAVYRSAAAPFVSCQ